MIVSKFGGTSVGDAAAIRRLVSVVRERLPEQPVVVVSALSGVTDRLLALEHQPADAEAAAAALVERHATVIRDLDLSASDGGGLVEDIRSIGSWVTARGGEPWTSADRDWVVSHGELWSSRIVAGALRRADLAVEWVDARQVIATDDEFGHATPDQPEIARRAQRVLGPILSQGRVPVTQGFIGATVDGRTTTLGRGGSDYTASLLGAALEAERVEIWTDVDGIMTADPRIVPDARLLHEASYDEAAELAAFGAKVLHPATQLPLVDAGIPCLVRNSFAPERPGTRIVAETSAPNVGPSPARSVAWKRGVALVNVQAPRMLDAVGFLQGLFGIFARHDVRVDVLASSEVNVSVTVDDEQVTDELVADLGGLGRVTVYERRAIVAVIGRGLRGTCGFAGRLFHAVRHINLEAITQGASEINVTFVVAESDGPEAVRSLHQEFFGAARASELQTATV